MKPRGLFAAALVAIGCAAVVCWYRGRGHDAERPPSGGFRCRTCGKAGADLSEMGLDSTGYVEPVRRVYDRDGKAFSQTSDWAATKRGW